MENHLAPITEDILVLRQMIGVVILLRSSQWQIGTKSGNDHNKKRLNDSLPNKIICNFTPWKHH